MSGRKVPAALVLLVATAGWGAEKAKPATSVPGAAEILSHLRPSHPRLLASMEDFAALQKRLASDPQLQTWKGAIEKQGREILAATPSRYEIPDGLRLLDTSRRVMNRIYTLAMLYRLDGDRAYADRAWKELEAAAQFPDWNPRHFLDTAEMTHAFAIGYDWLYDVWTPEQRNVLREAMVKQGFEPALKLYRARSGWTRMRHNWNQVCNGGMGMGALALADVEPQAAGEILHGALESLPLAMAEFAPDGAWKEGPGYWNYATFYNVVFLAGLQSALGTEFGLSETPGFRQTGLFPIYLTGPLGRTFNYADGGDRAVHAAQLFWLARRFNQPVLAWSERQVPGPGPLDLLWYDSEGAGPKTAGFPLDKYFREAEVVSLRSEWENPKAVYVGFKAGDNKANHSHLDLGSFVFDALGVRWASDLGADNYNLPGYFGGQRWTYYRLRAEGQNTLVLNPSANPDQDPGASTRIVRFKSDPDLAYAIADLTPAYKKDSRKVWRGLGLVNRNVLLVQDEIQAEKPADVWWFMHTPAAVEIKNDGRSAELQQVGARLRAEILSPEGAGFQLMDAQPLPESPHPARQAKNEGTRKLAIHLNGIKSCRLAVVLVPVTEDRGQSAAQFKLKGLSEW
jgi:hypothetical protein